MTVPDEQRMNGDLFVRAGQVFQPATPVQEKKLFAGRIHQIAAVADAVGQPGLHVVIYGERGVGKTSLANILGQLELPGIRTVRVSCDGSDTFGSAWTKLARRLSYPRTTAGFKKDERDIQAFSAELPTDPGPDDIFHLLANLDRGMVCIFDEFDRMPPAHARLFPDLIKALSDSAIPSTVVIVGVADTVTDLVYEHESIERALVQVPMPRMNDEELHEILSTAADTLGITFTANATKAITTLSQGLPHYTHLVGRDSVRAAAKMGQLCVSQKHVREGITAAILDTTQETIRDQYERAVRSARQDALYKQVLLACALAEKGERSTFRASGIIEPMSEIMGRPYDIPAISMHLRAFCQEDRAEVLARDGKPRNYVYRFRNPLMESYVLMRGISEELIKPEQVAAFTPSSS